MSFYDLNKEERNQLVLKINNEISEDLFKGDTRNILKYFSDDDTYIRKTGYLAIGKIFYEQSQLQTTILLVLKQLMQSKDELIRQTVVNAAGEIGNFILIRFKNLWMLVYLMITIVLEMQ